MKIAFRSIRAKLFVYFSGFFLIIVSFIGYNLWIDTKESSIEQIDMGLAKINLQILTIGGLERDFLENEITNHDFYKLRYSAYLTKRDSIVTKVLQNIDQLAQTSHTTSQGLDKAVTTIKSELVKYERNFRQMIQLIKKKGFKDAGLEGQMRRYIHAIEVSGYSKDLTTLLMARRYEKDFIIRKDLDYVQQVDSISKELKKEIEQKVQVETKKNALFNLLEKYRVTFLELVGIEEKIGFDNRSGLRKELNDSFEVIKSSISQINRMMLIETEYIHANIQRSNWVALVLFLISFILFSSRLIHILSRPVRLLSNSIHEIVSKDFSTQVPFIEIKQKDEVGKLSADFAFMLKRMHDYISEIKTKSSNLEQKQRLLMDSIRYAEQIQRAILPEKEELQSVFKDFFVMYKPADLVSGDFYWLSVTEHRVFLAVVDCTGHGVPGAFMSMIGNTLLNKIVKENHSQNPAEILEELHIEVKIALHQEKYKNDDGMDVCLCMMEGLNQPNQEVKVVYAGAKRPLWYFNEGELTEIKATKRSIGGQSKYRPFDNHSFTLPSGSKLYLTTDGFNDQHDVNRKKFGKLRLMEMVKQHAHLPMPDQVNHYTQVLKEHMQGNVHQRDDITIVGVQL
ncbi:SpoIIE family protein phosphatase [uncultured Microscilla sp.]|uniref:PP2C family protein-serine/threonine phosphatase n=1 Tax=uncultured Microscilla sp. TaxID=432653 RepID=UPI002603EB36|nr:SpoIIE family protein phosphatase [uncultured Microscilla sp.]